MTIRHVLFHHGLLVLAIMGLIACVRVFRVVAGDRRALKAQRANGGKAIIVETRIYQSAFLMSVFALLVALGARITLATELEMSAPLMKIFVPIMDLVAFLLMTKEWIIFRSRQRQEQYYEAELAHRHRRSTDIITEGPHSHV